ncbi:MAG: NAD(P)-dependent oxidoreductase [Lysobacterales bacterium]
MKLAFVGLGVMGFPMAGHLRRAGHTVTVFNRSSEKAVRWVEEYGGHLASTPAEASEGAQVIALCVGNDDDVRQVMLGDSGVLAGLQPSGIVVDHTTTSAILAREMATVCAEKQVSFLDAPVSGGQAGAEGGQLTVMLGGDEAAFDIAQPVLRCYSRSVQRLGDSGTGQLCKMVNQICLAGLLQGLAEGLQFAGNAGLNKEQVVDVISKGAAQSWQMDNRAQTMIADEYDFGFAVDWMRKDLGIALTEGRRNGSTLEVTALVDQFYAELQSAGGGRWDTSSLLRRLSPNQAASKKERL